MTTADVSATAARAGRARPQAVPPLEAGDRLSAAEFMRRYEAEERDDAQLIEGVVYLGSPLSTGLHGRPHMSINYWLCSYADRTPGLIASDNSTTMLDADNVPQHDALLAIPEYAGGQSSIDDDKQYLHGPPELVVEVASSSASVDLHDKLNAYRRNGVLEYVVWRTRDAAIDWFAFEGGASRRLEPNDDGLICSGCFPGLWLDVHALLRHDLAGIAAAVERGCNAEPHAAFAARVKPND